MSEENVNLGNLFEVKSGEAETADKTQPKTVQSDNSGEVSYSPSRTNNYKTIRGLSQLFKIVAWISVGIAGIFGLLALGSSNSGYNGPGPEFYFSLIMVFQFLMVGALMALFSEGINVFLDIEANSRQTAKTLERILRSQG